MAEIKIYRDEAEDDILPEVCAQCGQPSTLTKDKTFRWHPQWLAVLIILGGLGLIIYAILALAMTKTMRIRVPLCEEHRNHWLWRMIVIIGGFVILLAGFFVGMFAASNQGNQRAGDDLSGYVCMASTGFGLVWLIIAAILQNTAIRPKEITDRHIVLAGVNENFKEAMLDEREREEEREAREYEERRSRRRIRPDDRRDDDYDR